MFNRLRSASRLLVGLLMFGYAFMSGLLGGCQSVDTPTNTFDRGGATLKNPSPVTLDIQDDEKRGTASGVGPARWTSITGEQLQTFQTGSTPRDVWVRKSPDGTLQFNLSSGTDVTAEGIEFDQSKGVFKIAKFGTNASEPIRAGNEAFDKLVDYWKSLPQTQKDALVAQMDTIKAAYPSMESVLSGLIKALTGGVFP